jgi:hypothetical protein
MTLKITVFWNLTPCVFVYRCQRSGGSAVSISILRKLKQILYFYWKTEIMVFRKPSTSHVITHIQCRGRNLNRARTKHSSNVCSVLVTYKIQCQIFDNRSIVCTTRTVIWSYKLLKQRKDLCDRGVSIIAPEWAAVTQCKLTSLQSRCTCLFCVHSLCGGAGLTCCNSVSL